MRNKKKRLLKELLKDLDDLSPRQSKPKKEKKEKKEETLKQYQERLEMNRGDRNNESKDETSKKVSKVLLECSPHKESKKLYFGFDEVGPVTKEEMETANGTKRVEFYAARKRKELDK
jgi:hypothetical protein